MSGTMGAGATDAGDGAVGAGRGRGSGGDNAAGEGAAVRATCGIGSGGDNAAGATCGIGSGGTGLSSCARARTGAAINSKNDRGHVAARNTLACKVVLVRSAPPKWHPATLIEITAELRRAPGQTANLLYRGRTRPPSGGEPAHARRSAVHCSRYRQAAGVGTRGRGRQNKP